MTSIETEPRSAWHSSREELEAARVHRCWLPSGERALIRFIDLETYLLRDDDPLPEDLLKLAMAEVGLAEPPAESAKDSAFFRKALADGVKMKHWAAAETLVEPSFTVDEIREGALDPRDVELLSDIALRGRKTDARGVFLGVVPLDLFVTFRDVHELIGGAQWAEGHPAGLVEACPACQSLERALSSAGEE